MQNFIVYQLKFESITKVNPIKVALYFSYTFIK